MGMNTVSVVGPRAVQREPEKEKVSDLDKIMQGIQLASGILGIGVNIQSIRDHQSSIDTKDYNLGQSKQSDERALKGIVLPGEAAKLQTTNQVSESPLKDAVRMQSVEGKPLFVAAKGQAEPAMTPYQAARIEIEQGKLKAAQAKPQAAAKSGVRVDEGGISASPKLAEAKPQKPATESQSKAALFGKRMVQAEAVFSDLEKGGYDRASVQQGISNKLPGVMQGKEIQMQTQAEDNFLSAVLRKESGAAIGKNERADGEIQYFPRAGDSPEVIEQKRQNRELAIAGMAAEGGQAFDNIKMPEQRTVSTQESGTARAAARGRQRSPKDGKFYIETAPNAWQLDPNQGE